MPQVDQFNSQINQFERTVQGRRLSRRPTVCATTPAVNGWCRWRCRRGLSQPGQPWLKHRLNCAASLPDCGRQPSTLNHDPAEVHRTDCQQERAASNRQLIDCQQWLTVRGLEKHISVDDGTKPVPLRPATAEPSGDTVKGLLERPVTNRRHERDLRQLPECHHCQADYQQPTPPP